VNILHLFCIVKKTRKNIYITIFYHFTKIITIIFRPTTYYKRAKIVSLYRLSCVSITIGKVNYINWFNNSVLTNIINIKTSKSSRIILTPIYHTSDRQRLIFTTA